MRARTNKVGPLDRGVSGLVSESEDIEEVMGDTEDASMCKVELRLPCERLNSAMPCLLPSSP